MHVAAQARQQHGHRRPLRRSPAFASRAGATQAHERCLILCRQGEDAAGRTECLTLTLVVPGRRGILCAKPRRVHSEVDIQHAGWGCGQRWPRCVHGLPRRTTRPVDREHSFWFKDGRHFLRAVRRTRGKELVCGGTVELLPAGRHWEGDGPHGQGRSLRSAHLGKCDWQIGTVRAGLARRGRGRAAAEYEHRGALTKQSFD